MIGQGLISCSASKPDQCQQLFLTTQKMTQASLEYRNTRKAEDILKIAASFEQTADTLATLKFNDPRLSDFQQQLVTIYRGNSEASRSMLKAIASQDILTATLAQDQVQHIGKQEQQVITDLNRYCQTP
jgi:transketolase